MTLTTTDGELPNVHERKRASTTVPETTPLYVCSGLQGCGSTLVSWCFLQRTDMNGVLDGANDVLPSFYPGPAVERLWYKTTIGGFRLGEVVMHYRDLGWRPRPLLIVRDVRYVWASLIRKTYRHNGITAEDPPLRLRFRRFLEDWESFRRHCWPILRYEDFIAAPEQTLRIACAALELPWDEAMLHWPKLPGEIAHVRQGNRTFWRHSECDLAMALAKQAQERSLGSVSEADCDFLEREFAAFNESNGYPLRLEPMRADHPTLDASEPTFEQTRRFGWEHKRNPLRRLLHFFGAAPERHRHRLAIE